MASIGRYEIEHELGRGAMGVVYLARDPHLHRQVAVKTYALPEGISKELAKEFHERFLREARAAASLSHPGLVTVYDAGEDPDRGVPYIAMEFVQGQSLKQRLERGERLDPSWVLAMGALLADALHVAHKAGIIHRDIKPANILIRAEDGAAKIADFGVARLKSSDLTQSGAALGSPGYMSPEQVRGAALDGRSDLFSLAVVLYEAFCGKRPFQGEDLVSLAYSIAHDTQVPLTRHFPGCPAGLNQFFDRALSKNPDQRFPDGPAFRAAFLEAGKQIVAAQLDRTVVDANTVKLASPATQALAADLGEGPAKTTPMPGRARRGRFLPAALAALALLAAGLAAAAYLRYGGPALLKAGDREAPVTRQAAASVGRPAPLLGAAARDGESARQEPGIYRAPGDVRQEPPLHHEPEAAPLEPATRRAADTVPRGQSTWHESGAAPQGQSLPRSQAAQPQRTDPRSEDDDAEVEPAQALPPIPRNPQVTLAAGTTIHLSLIKPVGSSSSQAGDSFTATVTEPVVAGDRVVIPAGSRVHGLVSEVIPARKGLANKAGSLSLSFDRVVTPDGAGAPMSAALTRVGSKSTKKTAGMIGGGAAGGALLGKILGGNTRSAAVGSVLGGAIGTGVAAGTSGEDVQLPAGSPLTVKLDQPLTISINP